MARWRPGQRARIEAPEWYRVYHPEQWDEPDGQEQQMMDGSRGYGEWPAELHRIHSDRRWHQAQHAYRQEHPAFAEQELDDLLASCRDRHSRG